MENRDQEIFSLIQKETQRQKEQLQMIPSENYASKEVLQATGSILTNKYSEGYPGKRYYQGNLYMDAIEKVTIERAKKLFSAEHANIQSLSGTPANLSVYIALLNPGDRVLAMGTAAGGHLSHGSPVSISSVLFKFSHYGVDRKTQRIDYKEVAKLAQEIKPKLIVCGASAYPRVIDFKKFGDIAKAVGAYLLVDIAHIAGLVVAGLHPSPFPWADVVTTTTHKTLRGPRGAIILCKKKYAQEIDRAVFPGGVQAGPHNNLHAAKAVCFWEAMQPEYKKYIEQVVKNAKVLAEELKKYGFDLVSGGTDTHLLLIDLRSKKVSGRDAAEALENAGIVVNKNLVPFDPETPMNPSGIRLGTPAITSRGMGETEMQKIASWISEVVKNFHDKAKLEVIKNEIRAFCTTFPVPGIDF